MKILFINPNITDSITEVMASEARRSASPGTEIVAVTAKFGTLYIENRVEAAIASHAVLEALAEYRADCDAAIISAFGDPGLHAARELMDIPVLGISEAAFLIAYTQGRSYSIVCLTKRLRTWYMECAAEHGLDGRSHSRSEQRLRHPQRGRRNRESETGNPGIYFLDIFEHRLLFSIVGKNELHTQCGLLHKKTGTEYKTGLPCCSFSGQCR